MPAKRAASNHVANQKRSKVQIQMASFVATEEDLEFNKDLRELTEMLKKDRSKMKSVKAMAACEVVTKHDAALYFHPSLQGLGLSRLPEKFPRDDFLPTVPGWNKVLVNAWYKNDKKSSHKVLYKISMTLPSTPIGPMKSRSGKTFTCNASCSSTWRKTSSGTRPSPSSGNNLDISS